MKDKIVRSLRGVTLIGGGYLGIDDLELALSAAPDLVAADGGAGPALDAGHVPLAVIGDFDSIRAGDRDRMPKDRLFPIREQDSTDFEKSLRRVAAPIVLGIGFLGGRVDHQLAVLNALVRNTDCPCVLLGPGEVVFHAPRRLALDLVPGQVVSLFPLSPVTGRSTGLEWPIDGLELSPDGQVGTSNRALGPVVLETDGPGLLVIVPRDALDGVIASIGQGLAPDRPG